MKTDSGGNGVSEDNPDIRNPAATTDDDTKTNTSDGVESRTESRAGEQISDHPSNTANQKKKADSGTHRAGFDAFMTAYIFAHSCTLIKKEGEGAVEEGEEVELLPSSLNKIYLSGKVAPLNVVKSTFAKSSKAHVQKMEMVWGGRV